MKTIVVFVVCATIFCLELVSSYPFPEPLPAIYETYEPQQIQLPNIARSPDLYHQQQLAYIQEQNENIRRQSYENLLRNQNLNQRLSSQILQRPSYNIQPVLNTVHEPYVNSIPQPITQQYYPVQNVQSLQQPISQYQPVQSQHYEQTRSEAHVDAGTQAVQMNNPYPQQRYLGNHVENLAYHPRVQQVLASTPLKKRYLVLHPNGTVEHIDKIEHIVQQHPNYILVNAGSVAPKPYEPVVATAQNLVSQQPVEPVRPSPPVVPATAQTKSVPASPSSAPVAPVALVASWTPVVPATDASQANAAAASSAPEAPVAPEAPDQTYPVPASPSSVPVAPVAPVASLVPVVPATDAAQATAALAPPAPVAPEAPDQANPVPASPSSAPVAPVAPVASSAPVVPATDAAQANPVPASPSLAPVAPVAPVASSVPVVPATDAAQANPVPASPTPDPVVTATSQAPASAPAPVAPIPAPTNQNDTASDAKPILSASAQTNPLPPSTPSSTATPVLPTGSPVPPTVSPVTPLPPTTSSIPPVTTTAHAMTASPANAPEASDNPTTGASYTKPCDPSTDLDVLQLDDGDKEPVIWFRTKDLNFWDKLTSGDETYDVIYIFNVPRQPRMEKEVKTTIHADGTVVEEITQTIYDDEDGAPPRVIKTTKVTKPDGTESAT